MRKLEVRYRSLEQLVPYARNARTHSDAQIAEIGASILEYGWTNPVLVDEHGVIIAGHGRVLAARWLRQHHPGELAKKGISLDELPTIELSGLSEAQRTGYVIADNKLALNAGWNADMLAAELMRLSELGAPYKMTGFSQAEAENIIAGWQAGPEMLGGDVGDEWQGMPEFGPEKRSYRSIVVHLQDEQALIDFKQRMQQEFPEKAKYIWHPFKPKQDLKEREWGAADEREPAAADEPAAAEG